MHKDRIRAVFVTAFCLFLNLFLKNLVSSYSVPFWLDSVGTMLAAYILGPFSGAIVGASANIIYFLVDPISLFYSFTSVAVGLSFGFLARKGYFETMFKTLTACSIITLIATVISTVINCIGYHGAMGNVWGDGISGMLIEFGMQWIPASFIAEFFLEFLDKFLSIMFVHGLIRLVRFGKKTKWSHLMKPLLGITASVIVFHAFSTYSYAQENSSTKYSKYVQTIYGNDSGLLSGEANDIATTDDGIIWIGTYAGLYRYSGNDFRYINQFRNVKNVNCLYVDIEGRLWIGTNDDGLSICIDEEIVNTFDEDHGFPSNSVRSIIQNADGNYYVGTSGELAIISLTGGVNVVATIPEINYATTLTANDLGNIAAVTASGGLYLVKNGGITDTVTHPKGKSFSSCEFISNKVLYVGDDQGDIYFYDVVNDKLSLTRIVSTDGLNTINDIYILDNDDIFFCADNGIGWMDEKQQVQRISTGSFNSSIDCMTEDYQGNLWFASSRLGVLKLTESSFLELYPEANLSSKVVNTITEWNGVLYFGTDEGLDAITMDGHKPVTNALTEYIKDTRIRSLMVDSKQRLWICAYGLGIVCAEDTENFVKYTSKNGALGTKFRTAIELSDHSYAIASDLGITLLKDGKVTETIGLDDGLKNELVLCMVETADHKILAGTDGGGIAVIQNGKIVSTITRQEGLSSGVILRIVRNQGTNEYFVVTSNGICYIDEELTVHELTTFPYSNNYDILDTGNGELYVTGSAGIFIVNKEELVNNDVGTYTNLNYLSGLRSTLTANAWNYVDENGFWYIAAGSGVTQLDLNTAGSGNIHSYRMLLKSVTIDNVVYTVHDDRVIHVPRGAKSIQLNPEIINYSTTEPYVCYYLEGSDEERKVVLQSELKSIVYGALSVGTYRFHLAIVDGANGEVTEEIVYTIDKEAEIYDYLWFKGFFFLELIFITVWFTWFITRKLTARTMELQKREIALAKNQVRMGNETILAIARTVDVKDANTSQHSARVAQYSIMIAERMGYSSDEIENLRKTALLHDIGKIGIPDSVLNKPGRLTDEEYEIMKSHVTRGAEILKDFTLVSHVQEGALYHHERYDGTGYASGLKGKDIPETARIIGVADAFDAMTANRVYRKKLSFDVVMSELRNGSGKQFDPDIVAILIQLIEEGKIDVASLYEEEQHE